MWQEFFFLLHINRYRLLVCQSLYACDPFIKHLCIIIYFAVDSDFFMFHNKWKEAKKNEYCTGNNAYVPLHSICNIGKGCEKYDVSIFNAER